jgi:hypothetical protein
MLASASGVFSATFQELLGRFFGAVTYACQKRGSHMPSSLRLTSPGCRRRPLRLVFVAAAVAAVGCNVGPAPLTQLLEARRLASDLHVQFSKAADAANRAVMSDTDVASAAAADEARRARGLVEQDVEALRPILQSLRYGPELGSLSNFTSRFDEYRRLDDEILPLAAENTNLKAQRLSFGAAQQAADAFRGSIDAVIRTTSGAQHGRIEAAAHRAVIALLEIQVLQAPHIASADDAAMTQMEQQMGSAEASARKALVDLRAVLPAADAPRLAEAVAALDRFKAVNDEILVLSRRNSNVRSLALSLGEKRKVTAAGDDQLRMLEEALAKHEFAATR